MNVAPKPVDMPKPKLSIRIPPLPSEDEILMTPLESPCAPIVRKILPCIKILFEKHLFGTKI